MRLFRLGSERSLVTATVTNSDGRTDEPLVADGALEAGTYELEFGIGDYFRGLGHALAEPAFLDDVVIRVALREDENYHVPLLASPWGYSTYRGS